MIVSNDKVPKQFSVWQVANGFKVTPTQSFSRGDLWSPADEHVFPTWDAASKWLGDQFREYKPGGPRLD